METHLRELERKARSTGDRNDIKEFFINYVRSRNINLSNMQERQDFFEMLADFKVRGVDCAYKDAVTLIYLIHLSYGMNNPGIHLTGTGGIRLDCFPDVSLSADRWDLDWLTTMEGSVRVHYMSFGAGRIRGRTEIRRRPTRLGARVGFQITYPNLGWQILDRRELNIPDNGIISFHTPSSTGHEQSLEFIRERMIPLVAQVNPELAVVVLPDPLSFD